MKPQFLTLHCYAEKEGAQWSAVCLDYTLAAQADTLDGAKAKLVSMIKEYLKDALKGEDLVYQSHFLKRRAPPSEWVKYYFFSILAKIIKSKDHQPYDQQLPLTVCP